MKLLFVYNADSSLFSQLNDYAHKIISPKTYQCNLCALTYSHLGMKTEWKKFIASLPVKSDFLHKDEFLKTYSDEKMTDFPSVFMYESEKLHRVISAEELNSIRDIDNLKQIILKKIAER